MDSIRVGEPFQLFAPGRTEAFYFGDDLAQLFSGIYLETGVIEPFLVTVFAELDHTLSRIDVVAPFNPRQGYQVTREDVEARTRKLKIEAMKDELVEQVHGLILLVGYAEDAPENIFRQAQTPLVRAFFDLLHLTLTFPDGAAFAARSYVDPVSFTLTFEKFFPSDTGPLPVVEPIRSDKRVIKVEEGFRLLLPPDLEKLRSIQGRFLSIPE